jgi:hypothetical protein
MLLPLPPPPPITQQLLKLLSVGSVLMVFRKKKPSLWRRRK